MFVEINQKDLMLALCWLHRSDLPLPDQVEQPFILDQLEDFKFSVAPKPAIFLYYTRVQVQSEMADLGSVCMCLCVWCMCF